MFFEYTLTPMFPPELWQLVAHQLAAPNCLQMRLISHVCDHLPHLTPHRSKVLLLAASRERNFSILRWFTASYPQMPLPAEAVRMAVWTGDFLYCQQLLDRVALGSKHLQFAFQDACKSSVAMVQVFLSCRFLSFFCLIYRDYLCETVAYATPHQLTQLEAVLPWLDDATPQQLTQPEAVLPWMENGYLSCLCAVRRGDPEVLHWVLDRFDCIAEWRIQELLQVALENDRVAALQVLCTRLSATQEEVLRCLPSSGVHLATVQWCYAHYSLPFNRKHVRTLRRCLPPEEAGAWLLELFPQHHWAIFCCCFQCEKWEAFLLEALFIRGPADLRSLGRERALYLAQRYRKHGIGKRRSPMVCSLQATYRFHARQMRKKLLFSDVFPEL